jgi:hypothetical protein
MIQVMRHCDLFNANCLADVWIGLDWIESQLGSRHEHGWDVLWKMMLSSEKRENNFSSFFNR